MAYSLTEINRRIMEDPAGFTAEGDRIYDSRVAQAADMIEAHMHISPVVLLAGPSGSGKTTTAQKIKEELMRRGIGSHAVGMDNYFKTIDVRTAPRTPDGAIDYESPKCLDMELLSDHFTALNEGREIKIPYYVFSVQSRSASRFTPMRLEKNEGTTVLCKGGSRTYYISNAHFELCRLNLSGRMPLESGRMLLLTPMSECTLNWSGESMSVKPFETVIVPAALEGVSLTGNTKVLMSSPSDREKLRAELGYRAENVADLVD